MHFEFKYLDKKMDSCEGYAAFAFVKFSISIFKVSFFNSHWSGQ